MAWKIPVVGQSYEWDAEKRQFPMAPLADFVSRVSHVAKPADTLMGMCRSGGRSAIAVNFLAKVGFKNGYNLVAVKEHSRAECVAETAAMLAGVRNDAHKGAIGTDLQLRPNQDHCE